MTTGLFFINNVLAFARKYPMLSSLFPSIHCQTSCLASQLLLKLREYGVPLPCLSCSCPSFQPKTECNSVFPILILLNLSVVLPSDSHHFPNWTPSLGFYGPPLSGVVLLQLDAASPSGPSFEWQSHPQITSPSPGPQHGW